MIYQATKNIKKDSDNALWYNNRAWYLIKVNKFEPALQDADKAIGLNPSIY